MKYIIGTRGSKLSIAQTNWVISELKKTDPDVDFEIKTIKTRGDIDTRPIFTIEQKGIFEKEIDKAVAENQIHFAVHSLKDVPSNLPDELVLACIPIREPTNDILVTKDGSTLDSLPPNSVIGTSSLRRAIQISRKRPDVIVKPIRGNIETRIRKITDENFDGVVLAQAGINRLGLDVQYSKLSIEEFPPSPGQGALAIVARKNDEKTITMLKKIEDVTSRQEIEAERALSNYVDSGCRFPVGAYAQVNNTSVKLTVIAYSVDGKKSINVQQEGPVNEPTQLGKLVADELKEKGITELAINWREKVEEWNKK